MTAADNEAMTALHDLLDERQRYEGWIRGLEARKTSTPPHVYERVHTDYSLRLDRVLHRLSERTEQLQSTIEVMTSRLNALRTREADRLDARQEAELRAAVGEYSDGEWARLRDEADKEITQIGEERHGVERELDEMQRIIDLTRAPRPQQQAEASSASVPSAPAPSPAAQSSAPPRAAAPAAVAEPETPSIDNFVADWPVRQLTPQAPLSGAAQSDGIAEVPEVDAAVPPPPPPAPRIATPMSASIPTTPALEPRREQEKTLKCPECGTMNYATEWYCERCGGELATF